jgi:hypothetical protein
MRLYARRALAGGGSDVVGVCYAGHMHLRVLCRAWTSGYYFRVRCLVTVAKVRCVQV